MDTYILMRHCIEKLHIGRLRMIQNQRIREGSTGSRNSVFCCMQRAFRACYKTVICFVITQRILRISKTQYAVGSAARPARRTEKSCVEANREVHGFTAGISDEGCLVQPSPCKLICNLQFVMIRIDFFRCLISRKAKAQVLRIRAYYFMFIVACEAVHRYLTVFSGDPYFTVF